MVDKLRATAVVSRPAAAVAREGRGSSACAAACARRSAPIGSVPTPTRGGQGVAGKPRSVLRGVYGGGRSEVSDCPGPV